ncbi:MAG TPA: DUF3006 domain-containing protein [Gemmatimonadaceae bacterium]
MPAQTHRWVVDVLDETVASVEVDGDRMISFPRWLLPALAREGDVLRVTHDRPPNGGRSVLTIEIDAAGTSKALGESSAQIAKAKAKAKQRDQGGDISL